MAKVVPVSLADLADAGVRLRPTDAVTIVRALVLQVANGILPGVPSAHVIRLSPTGAITVEGPVVASGRPVPRAAQLLAALLGGSGRKTAEPPSLRRVIARAVQQPSGFATLQELAEAIEPFAARDSSSAIKELTARWAEAASVTAASTDDDADNVPSPTEDDAQGAGSLSVSDVRRARRDTGLSLEEVSKRSRIPVSMLRQLEWGYLRNWPTGLYGRTQLIRYARAAGLDRQLVLDAMLPLVPHHLEPVNREGERSTEAIAATTEPPASAAAPKPPKAVPKAPTPKHPVESPAIIDIDPATSLEPLVDEDRPAPVEQPLRPFTQPLMPSTAAPEVKPAAENPVERILADRGERPLFDPPLAAPHRSLSLLDPEPAAETAGRSSIVAAAAVLALAIGGAAWAVHSQLLSDDRVGAQMVRRLPAREQVVARAETGSTPPSGPRLTVPLSRPAVTPIVHPVPTSGVHPAADSLPAETAEDDSAAASAAFASAGGVVFADPVLPAIESADPAGGLGLRITRVVDDHSHNYHTRPSPDGTLVAFDSDRDGERAIFVANADGRNLRRVSGDGFAAVPNWSPDGRTLSFVRAEVDNPNVWNLWALDLDSGKSHRLTSNASGRPLGGSWFPDGHRIAYSGGGSIIVLDVATGKPAIYPSPQPGRKTGSPAVSLDGRWVIYAVSGDGAWLLDMADGSSRKVLSDPSIGDFTWSPDSGRVAYYNRREGEWNVWVMTSR